MSTRPRRASAAIGASTAAISSSGASVISCSQSFCFLSRRNATRRSDTEGPRPEHLGVLESGELAVEKDQDVLHGVVGIVSAHDRAEIRMQRRLHAAEERFERFSIVALGSQNPESLLPWRNH